MNVMKNFKTGVQKIISSNGKKSITPVELKRGIKNSTLNTSKTDVSNSPMKQGSKQNSVKQVKANLNLNDFARTITMQEGGKVSLPIGQVKEVIRLTMRNLDKMTPDQRNQVIARYREKRS